MSLRWKFTALFVLLGAFISLGVGFTIYYEYSNYMKYSYTQTMENVIKLADIQCTLVYDGYDRLKEEFDAWSDAYQEMNQTTLDIAASFDLAFVYFTIKHSPCRRSRSGNSG